MRGLPFAWVDAFTDRPFQGNPCVVVFEADRLDDAAMLAIAREMHLSETAFVLAPRHSDLRARYFTPAEEIPLAGHPTIALGAALVDTDRLPRGEGISLTLELPAGIVALEVTAPPDRAVRTVMVQLAPVFGASYDPEMVLPVVGLTRDEVLPGVPIQTVSTGTPQLMIPLRSRDALNRATLNTEAYARLRVAGDFFSPHCFIMEGATAEGHTLARHFGVAPDVEEDPFTGSATGGMACYCWRYGLLDRPAFVAEQGHHMGRPGRATVEVLGAREAIAGVRVGGEAVVVATGTLRL